MHHNNIEGKLTNKHNIMIVYNTSLPIFTFWFTKLIGCGLTLLTGHHIRTNFLVGPKEFSPANF